MARKKTKRKTSSAQADVPEKRTKEELISVTEEPDIICLNTPPRPPQTVLNVEVDEEVPPVIVPAYIGLANWCRAKDIPLDFEQRLLGVEFCNEANHLEFVTRIREKNDKAMKELDQAVWTHYQHNGQNSRIFAWKMQVRDRLYQEFRNLFPEYPALNLWAVGSTVNGCGSFNSDMDLCLCMPELSMSGPNYFIDRHRALKTLRRIERALRRPALREFIRRTVVISAKVPIIKVELQQPYAELDLDININNIAGVYNSHLLHYYSRVDVRFPALCLLVKHWAIRKDISDAMYGTFNSYSLILLVLHYLQCGVKPAVLPNLQYIMPDLFTSQIPLENLELYKDLHGLPDRPVNTMSIGDLLIGFFCYYNNFDFNTYYISIRAGKRCSRTELEPDDAKFYIFIEEPFDLVNTARCVTKEVCYLAIKRAFREATDAFNKKVPMLQHIGVQM